jgi:hypothetical protein
MTVHNEIGKDVKGNDCSLVYILSRQDLKVCDVEVLI